MSGQCDACGRDLHEGVPCHCVVAEEGAPPSKVYKLVNYHHEDGWRVCVVGEPGRKWVYAAAFDSPVRLLKLPNEEQKHMVPIQSLSVTKAAKKMLSAGKRLGITAGAQEFLRAVNS